MGLGFHGIWGPGHKSRDVGVGLGLFLLKRLGLRQSAETVSGQKSLGHPNPKQVWDKLGL